MITLYGTQGAVGLARTPGFRRRTATVHIIVQRTFASCEVVGSTLAFGSIGRGFES